ncbi:MAG TPA: trypsin-like peptidase domain-containing protein [Xanthomonadales bacterium]|nr:trypsin-like peptidase domain-containing protein [Xanthomonadales bacterium]
MSKTSEFLIFLSRAVITGLAVAFLVIYFWPSLAARLQQPAPEPQAPPAAAPASYADAVNRAAPAVVSIYTRSLLPQSADPDPERRGGGFRYLYRMSHDMGSGVIVSADGYILTNHHVINMVQNIRVALYDGRVVPAAIVGSDPETDLAVLKVKLEGLSAAPLAESTTRVGDVVLAIGNSLGLSHTVTMGIVSATGRNDLRSLPFEDFIQTDAAINAGNSGGALVNANGDLIGISTRKLGANTGAQNIGFAIPVTLAKHVMEQIIEYGSVRRAWLGASFVDIRPTLQPDGSVARAGIAVGWVAEDGPAWNAGIRQGDIIVSLDGEPVDDANQFQLAISQREPGSQVELDVVRRLESFQTYATLIQQPPL